jgi:hypothetical protein
MTTSPRRSSLIMAAVALLAFAAWLAVKTASRTGEASNGIRTPPSEEKAGYRGNNPNTGERARVTKSSRARTRGSRKKAEPVVVNPQQILTSVSGTPIRLAQLIAVRPDSREVVATERSIFRSRLQRAIEAELVFQAARAAGIGLTEAQKNNLDQIASRHAEDLEGLKPLGVTWDTVTEDQIALERHLKEAMLLRQNLVVAESGSAPSTSPEKQAAYEDALRQLLARLESKADIQTAPGIPN